MALSERAKPAQSQAASAADHCSLPAGAKPTIKFIENVPLVTVSIDRKPVHLILDTGAQETILTASAARRLGLHPRYVYRRRMHSLGSGIATGLATTLSFSAGRLALRSFIILVGPLSLPYLRERRPDGLLGADFLQSRRAWLSYSTKRIFLKPYRGR